MRDRNYFIGCLLQVITHTSLTQVCVYDTLRQSGFASFTQNSHKLPKKECQSKKKTTQTASLRGFLAGAVRIELTTRGFGGGYPYCLKLTYLRYIFLCIIENYDRFTTRLFYLCNVF